MGFLYSQLFVTPKVPTEPLDGETFIITGSNTGLGLAAAKHVANLRPTKLILAVRNLKKGEAARQELIAGLPSDSKTVIQVWQLDMSKFQSVLDFVDKCDRELDRIDGVSLNAGISVETFELNDGYESTIMVNTISTFLLALALQPVLLKSAQKHNIRPRISMVSSETHAWAKFADKATPSGESIFKTMSSTSNKITSERYMTSKLMQILIFRHLQKSLRARDGDLVIWNILNPGFCYSDIARSAGSINMLIMHLMRLLLARSTEVGGRPIATGLVAGQESNWQYMHDGVVDESALSSYVKSQQGTIMGDRLWNEIKEIVGGLRPELVKEL